MIEARVVKGFRDALPHEERIRQELMRRLAVSFYADGYQAIDTPVLEYAETLLGKSGGETEKQIFRFKDAGNRDLAMRFDLTVPLSRYVSLHKEELAIPFKRYHMAKVWRGEKPQRGRYREFFQCDFDLVGSSGPESDLDILLTAHNALKRLGIQHFIMEINHRGLLLEYLERLGVGSHSVVVLRAIDKVDKVGWIDVSLELATILSNGQITALEHFIHIEESLDATFNKIRGLVASDSPALARMGWLIEQIKKLELSDYFSFNPKITRGLDYYTGMVFETFLTNDRALGSICSGGRYDNLMALYSKDSLSSVGGSIGLDRMLASESILKEIAIDEPIRLFIYHHHDYALTRNIAQKIQELGLVAEVFPDAKKVDAQTKYAIKKAARLVLFIEGKGFTLRDLVEKESYKDLLETDLLALIKERYLA